MADDTTTPNTANTATPRPRAAVDKDAVDPVDFLRAVLHISPGDAAKAREDAAKAMEREDRQRVADAEGDSAGA